MKIKMAVEFQDVYPDLVRVNFRFFGKFILHMLLFFKVVIWTYCYKFLYDLASRS